MLIFAAFFSISISSASKGHLRDGSFKMDAETKKYSQAMNNFATTFMKKTNSLRSIKNFVFSPICLFSALDLLYLGTNSKSKSHEELRKILDLEGKPESDRASHLKRKSINDMMKKLKLKDEFEFEIGTFINANTNRIKLKPSYKGNASLFHDTTFRESKDDSKAWEEAMKWSRGRFHNGTRVLDNVHISFYTLAIVTV